MKTLILAALLCVPAWADRIERKARPVATINWIGSTSTDWDTAANWSGGALPVSGDTVLVDSSAQRDLLLNLNRTGDGAGNGLNLHMFHVHASCTVDIGSASTPLRMCVGNASDSIFLNECNANEVHFRSETGAAVQVTTRIVQRGRGRFAYSSTGTGANGFILDLEITAGTGTVHLLSATATPFIWIASHLSQPNVTITGSTNITDLFLTGGTLELNKTSGTLTRIQIANGEFIHTLGTITHANQAGGVYYLDGTMAVGRLVGMGGELNTKRTPGQKTITALWYDEVFYGLDTDPELLTVTTPIIIGK